MADHFSGATLVMLLSHAGMLAMACLAHPAPPAAMPCHAGAAGA